MREYLQFYIDGQWVDPVEPKTLDVINPATEKVAGKISLGSAADVDKAVKAAKKAFVTWSQTTREERLDVPGEQFGVEEPPLVKSAGLVVRRALDEADEPARCAGRPQHRVAGMGGRGHAPGPGEFRFHRPGVPDLETQFVAEGRNARIE